MNPVRLTLALFLGILAAQGRAAVTVADLQQASIIFAGTVLNEPAPMADQVPSDTDALAVRVDEILVVPEALMLSRGDRVTVVVADRDAYPPDSMFTFYTTSLILADTMAVRVIAREAAPAAADVAAERARIMDAIRDARMQALVTGADAVIVGEVMSVAAPDDSREGAGREHNPLWTDAVVEVDEWLKGRRAGTTIVVRFPASNDMAWFDVPKLRPGMRRLLFLHTDTFSTATASPASAATVFVLLLSTDAQPISDAPLARRAVQETTPP